MWRTAVPNTSEDPGLPRMGDGQTEGGVTCLALMTDSAPNDFQAKTQGVLRGRSTFHKPALSPQWNYMPIKQTII